VQARLIGLEEEGKEIVRVDQVEGQIRRVPDDELQRKGHREYFRETLGRVAGELYWSPINLNREHGRIVEPYQPVLRVGMPVTDVDGKLFGIIILNVDIRRVFDAARDVVSPGVTLYIANREGDYLYHPDSEKTFGFDLGQRHRVQDDFTEAASLLESVRADIMKDILVPPGPEQVVAHLSLLPLRQDSDNTLLLGLTTPSEVVVGEVNAARRKAAVLILPFLLVGAVVVVWLVRIFIGPLERVTREVSRFAPGVHRQQLPEENRHDEVGLLAQAFSRMAHRIEHQVDELEDEKRRFQSLFETAPDAIIIIDQDGTIEYINGATERLFGYSPRELVGRDVNRLMPEPDKGRHDEYMERYLEGGEPHIIGIGRQVTGMHKDGHAIALYLSIGEFTLGGRRKFTGILHDISS
jgi:PAS domain S-box-containing protein